MFYYSLLPFLYSFTLYVFMSELVRLRAWDTVKERGKIKRGTLAPLLMIIKLGGFLAPFMVYLNNINLGFPKGFKAFLVPRYTRPLTVIVNMGASQCSLIRTCSCFMQIKQFLPQIKSFLIPKSAFSSFVIP